LLTVHVAYFDCGDSELILVYVENLSVREQISREFIHLSHVASNQQRRCYHAP
jgi:hypothetical protein